MLDEIEENIDSRRVTDRVMWFSMWFLLSLVTFGVAAIFMTYLLIKRRNAHFLRQEKLRDLALSKLRQLKEEKQSDHNSEFDVKKDDNRELPRNAYAWALSTVLIVPVFWVYYFLNGDLQRHEERERAFLLEATLLAKESGRVLHVNDSAGTKKFALNRYVVLTVVTVGLAAVYWLYRVFNDYNRHFKSQWKIEDELLELLRSAGEGSETS